MHCQLDSLAKHKGILLFKYAQWPPYPRYTVVCKILGTPGQTTCFFDFLFSESKYIPSEENLLLQILMYNYCLFTEFNVLDKTKYSLYKSNSMFYVIFFVANT